MSEKVDELLDKEVERVVQNLTMAAQHHEEDKDLSRALFAKALESMTRCQIMICMQKPSEDAKEWAMGVFQNLEEESKFLTDPDFLEESQTVYTNKHRFLIIKDTKGDCWVLKSGDYVGRMKDLHELGDYMISD